MDPDHDLFGEMPSLRVIFSVGNNILVEPPIDHLNCHNSAVAKVEDAPDPRHQGCSCSFLPQNPDNTGDGVLSAFPPGE